MSVTRIVMGREAGELHHCTSSVDWHIGYEGVLTPRTRASLLDHPPAV